MGHANIIKILLENNADIHLLDNDGLSALHVASSVRSEDSIPSHYVQCVQVLLSYNIDINFMFNENCTALHKGKNNYIVIVIIII